VYEENSFQLLYSNANGVEVSGVMNPTQNDKIKKINTTIRKETIDQNNIKKSK
jgi:hypothetical protein